MLQLFLHEKKNLDSNKDTKMPVICICRKIFLSFDTSQAELIKSLQSYLPYLDKKDLLSGLQLSSPQIWQSTFMESFLIY